MLRQPTRPALLLRCAPWLISLSVHSWASSNVIDPALRPAKSVASCRNTPRHLFTVVGAGFTASTQSSKSCQGPWPASREFSNFGNRRRVIVGLIVALRTLDQQPQRCCEVPVQVVKKSLRDGSSSTSRFVCRNCATSPQSANIGRTFSRASGERSQTSSTSSSSREDQFVPQRVTDTLLAGLPSTSGAPRVLKVALGEPVIPFARQRPRVLRRQQPPFAFFLRP